MNENTPEKPAPHGPGGSTAARVLFAAGHLVMVAAVFLFCVWLAKAPGPALRDRLPISRGPNGAIQLGGAVDAPIGTVSTESRVWRLRGLLGEIGTALVGETTISGLRKAPSEEDMARAGERIAGGDTAAGRLTARAYGKVGRFTLIEWSPSALGNAAATLAVVACGWAACVVGLKAARRRFSSRRSIRRLAQGDCPACGYRRGATAARGVCPECGRQSESHV